MSTQRISRWLLPQITVLALAPASLVVLAPVSAAVPDRAAATARAEALASGAAATTDAGLLGVTVAQALLPPPLGDVSAANVDVATATGSLGAGSPRVTASAANLGADAVGIDLSGILSEAHQTAPPDNATATTVQLATIPAAPLLTANLSTSTAHARQAADGSCPAPGTPLSSSTTTTTDASVLAIPDVGTLVNVPGAVSTGQSIQLPTLPGPGDVRAVSSTTHTNLAALSLFGSVDVGVSSNPRLTATASGRAGGAAVDYSQPVVTIAAAGAPGSPFVLDAANETATFALPENPLLQVELSLGTAERVVAADGTSASGQAALLHLRLALLPVGPLPGVTVAEVDVAPMKVAAIAPAGGVICAAPGVDSDGDGLSDAEEGEIGTDPTNPDTDGDGLGDGAEVNTYGTDPLDPDTDNGGVNDGTEVANGTNPVNNPADDVRATPGPGDPDGDGLDHGEEILAGTDPAMADTDGDGLSDGLEVNQTNTDPTRRDTDRDGLTDGQEVHGVTIYENFQVCGQKARKWIQVKTKPLRRDTDRDGLRDRREVIGYRIKQRVLINGGRNTFVIGRTRSNPARKDTDRDGLRDKVEKKGSANKRYDRRRTDPTTCDTDRGGINDGVEVKHHSDPSDVRSSPGDRGTIPIKGGGRNDRGGFSG